MPAFHAALGVITVFDESGTPVEPMIPVGIGSRITGLITVCNIRFGLRYFLVLAGPGNEEEQSENSDQYVWKPFLIQCQTFGSK